MRVLIAGCGYVGTALAQRLLRAGSTVYALRRDCSQLPAGVLGIEADLTRPETLGVIGDDVDRFVYAASPSERSASSYEDTYLRGVDNVATRLNAAGAHIQRALLTSSTAVYGQLDGEWVDEASDTVPTSFSGQILLRAEAAFAALDFETSCVRLAGIYGPGRTWLVRRVQAGEVDFDSPRFGNRIHQNDCAGSLAHLLRLERVDSVYVGVDNHPAPLGEVYRYVRKLLDRASDPPAKATGGSSGRDTNKRVSNRRLRDSGYAFDTPSYREGYPSIVEQYLAEGTSLGRR